MEILVALAVAGGLAALLLQAKPLPSDSDFNKASDKLKANPDDPDANATAGKYLAFVKGDYRAAMPFLAKSSDKTLKALAEHETDPTRLDTAHKKVGMGDEWVLAAKKFQPLFRIFFDRAAQWYEQAWKELPSDDFIWRQKLREQATKLSAARPPGGPRKGLPSGWIGEGIQPTLDGTIAHAGSYSVRIPHGDPKAAPGAAEAVGMLKANPIPVPAGAKEMEISAWIRSDGTDSPLDQLFVNIFNNLGVGVGTFGPVLAVDLPFWHYVSAKTKVPDGIVFVQLGAKAHSKTGNIWVDEVSLKFDGKEALKSGSFEDR